MRRRITMITIEKERIIEIILRSHRVKEWCGQCNRPVVMLAPEKAALVAGVCPRLIYRWVEAGSLHFIETSRGLLRVCVDSLIPLAQTAQEREQAGREQEFQSVRKEIEK
ncbi:MAG TPA: hypothetical protein VE262_13185 [Blastocatellia bacterium]|nr:hypothetical protein [Blastocatellia bacterium]